MGRSLASYSTPCLGIGGRSSPCSLTCAGIVLVVPNSDLHITILTFAYVGFVQKESLRPFAATVAAVIKKRCTVRLLIVNTGYI